jgi:chemotaxis protein CheD
MGAQARSDSRIIQGDAIWVCLLHSKDQTYYARYTPMKPDWYFDPRFALEAVKIRPGEYIACSEEKLLVTVVGSCVAACIWDPEARVGGMSQFMVPNFGSEGEMADSVSDYGVAAMDALISQLLELGGDMQRLQAKVFGGGNVLNLIGSKNAGLSSAKFVQDYLAQAKIPIIAKNILDIYPRKIYFFPGEGSVLVKSLKSLNNETIVQREEEYTARLLFGGTRGASRRSAN